LTSAISVNDVTKKYRLGAKRESLRDAISRTVLSPFRHGNEQAEFVALQDISFEVQRGETIGLIGPNGCGKTTLLKLISGITFPNSGTIAVAGRMSSLIELGAGFHPDLTGRENIFLNGTILGLGEAEIREKFDSIVSFAELERFIDTPVKHYSSGMYVRLGFSVAIHVDPDILLVDEVLSVGDYAFQMKCIDRIQAMREREVTLIIVSHNQHLIEMLATRAIFLYEGQIQFNGDPVRAFQEYYNRASPGQQAPTAMQLSTRKVKIGDTFLLDADRRIRNQFEAGERIILKFYVDCGEPIEEFGFFAQIRREDIVIHGTNTTRYGLALPDGASFRGYLEVDYKQPTLTAGNYWLHLGVRQKLVTLAEKSIPFEICSAQEKSFGFVGLEHTWEIRSEDDRV
jgi:ABC-type polysaccharide/polyol phosphate transport system ATPase subunit